MRNIAVILVFLLALAGFVDTLVSQAEADTFVRIEPTGMSAPVALSADGATVVAGNGKDDDKKKKKKKKQDDKDEEDEEDYRSYSGGIGAVHAVDPDVLDAAVKQLGAQPLYR